MKKIYSISILSILTFLLFSCSSSNTTKSTTKEEPYILTISDEKIPVSEFNYVYKKNNSKNGDAYSEKSLNEYMNLYVNFRLKVKEAEELGYDTTKEFLREFNQYKDQLAQPYLTEKSVTEKLIKEAYERLNTEINASHILIRFPNEPSPEDTLRAFKKIKEIQKQLQTGIDFETLAAKVSEDPSAKKNNGKLGYFTALQMVYPFESAAYNTNKGEISDIVRTNFGYHILKVNDRRPARGEVKISHIMLRASEGMNSADLETARKKIVEIYDNLVKGEDWNSLCSQFSEDNRTAQDGGALPWISTGKVSPEFEDAAFSLSNKGDFSKPVQSPYGWHIIKLDDKKGLESYQDMKSNLKTQIEKDSRANLPKQAFIKRVKKEDNFIENEKTKTYAFSKIDSTLINGTWKFAIDDKKLKSSLFSIQSNNYSIEDFFAFLTKRQRKKEGANYIIVAQNMYNDFVEESLQNYEKSILSEKYEDYRLTLKEYKYGILLFKLMDEKVWSKAIQDTLGLKSFYEENKGKYLWNDRYKVTIISAANSGTLTDAIKDYKTKKYSSLNELEKVYNKTAPLTLNAENGIYELKDKPYFSEIDGTIGEFRKLFNDRYFYFDVTEKIPAGPKEFDETRGLLISDYQSKLESDWLKELKSKFPNTINQEEFDKLVH